VLYAVTTESGINSWADIKGKRLFDIGQGSTPDFLVRKLLSENGLTPGKDVTLDFSYSHPELAQALIAGKESLAVLPEPFVTMVLQKSDKAKVVMNLQDEWAKTVTGDSSYPMTSILISTTLIENRPGVAKAFLEEYKNSINWVNSNTAEAAKLVEKNDIGMTAKVAEAAIPRCNLKFTSAAESRNSVESFLSVFLDFAPESIGGSLPDDAFYYTP